MRWPAAHGERRARFVCRKARRERVGGWIAWMVENSSGPGGAAGAHSAHKTGAGALGPRPCFGFAGPSGPQNAAAPRRNPTTPAYPRASAPSPALGRLPGSAGRMGRSCGGGGGVQGPGPKAPAPEHARCRACPAAGGWAKPTRRRPPEPLGFLPTPKNAAKSQAFRPTQPRPVHHPEKGGSDREPLRGRLQPSRRAERAFFRRGAATE